MCVIAEKKLQLNSASLYVVVIFIIGGILIGGGRLPPLATPMVLGAMPPAAGRFFLISWKKSYFSAIELHFARNKSHLKKLYF